MSFWVKSDKEELEFVTFAEKFVLSHSFQNEFTYKKRFYNQRALTFDLSGSKTSWKIVHDPFESF